MKDTNILPIQTIKGAPREVEHMITAGSTAFKEVHMIKAMIVALLFDSLVIAVIYIRL